MEDCIRYLEKLITIININKLNSTCYEHAGDKNFYKNKVVQKQINNILSFVTGP